METPTLTLDVNQFAQINLNAEVYKFDIDMSEYPKIVVDLDAQKQTVKDKVNKDFEILLARGVARENRPNDRVMVGDFVKKKNGSYLRVSVVSEETYQAYEDGSCHIFKNGSISYSGSCGYPEPQNTLRLMDEKRAGMVWFFSDDWSGAHRGVYGKINFNVWEEI